MKIVVSHWNGHNLFILNDREVQQILRKSCSQLFKEHSSLSQSPYDYTVPLRISYLINRKILFVVDPRVVGYELNTSVRVVNNICDDISFVNFLEGAAAIFL
ncbi:hypothetical protein AHAS_Ahas18G0202400 [Arachis hypogaea]